MKGEELSCFFSGCLSWGGGGSRATVIIEACSKKDAAKKVTFQPFGVLLWLNSSWRILHEGLIWSYSRQKLGV